MNEMQQEAGDHSKQIQMKNCNCILVKGIDEKRVREICDEKNLALIKELTEEARSIAEQRIKIFEDALISRIRCLENSLEAFIEPAFQFVLKEAQKTAAKRAVDNLKDAIFYLSLSYKDYYKTREIYDILRHHYFDLKKEYEKNLSQR